MTLEPTSARDDIHTLMDTAEALSCIIHGLEARGIDLSDAEEGRWSVATFKIQEMREKYGTRESNAR